MPMRSLAAGVLCGLLAACAPAGPQEIDTRFDACSRCRMSIDRLTHAGEMLMADGRIRKYDSLGCLALDYRDATATGTPPREVWVVDHATGRWLNAGEAYFALAGLATDHMGYGVAAAASSQSALKLAAGAESKVVRWRDLPASVAAIERARHD